MSFQFAELAQSAAADGQVTSEELLALRRLGWGDGVITREEAEAIFAINRSLKHRDEEWVAFFVEALGEFVLNGSEPKGMCDEGEARWLIKSLDSGGRLESFAELELLVRVLECASNVPDSLKRYALQQIETAVLTGSGPTRGSGALSDSHVNATECSILRRLVFSSGGSGPAAVSRSEAEMLFRIKDATLNADNAPEWAKMFLDGVSNYLEGFVLAGAQLDHARMQDLENFMGDNRANIGNFMARMAREIPNVRDSFGKVFGQKQAAPGFMEREASGAEITDAENRWLENMIDRDGRTDPLEDALLARLKQQA